MNEFPLHSFCSVQDHSSNNMRGLQTDQSEREEFFATQARWSYLHLTLMKYTLLNYTGKRQVQLKYLNRKQIDFSRRCYDLFFMLFSDLFLSSSTNRRFPEVGSSFLQLLIIVGPPFFRQRVVVYIVVISDIHASALATSFDETRGKHEKSRRVACPRRKTLHLSEYPFRK